VGTVGARSKAARAYSLDHLCDPRIRSPQVRQRATTLARELGSISHNFKVLEVVEVLKVLKVRKPSRISSTSSTCP
jgi:hypothetical protein